MPDISTNHLSVESLSFIKSCIKTCLDGHTLCRRKEEGLPARILDVGRDGDGDIRLVNFQDSSSSSSSSPGEYVALSYCWGDGVTMKTTLGSLEGMMSGINLSDLPKSYSDAVTLTRALGIRYLWIDALCIIQDKPEDWEAESAKLVGVYANAFLTIAATAAASANQAFLRRGHQPGEPVTGDMDTWVFSTLLTDGEHSFLLKARTIPRSGLHSRWEGSSDVQPPSDRWSRRGWTLQEQLLSSRMLSFSTTELQWVCQEAVMCECRSRLNLRRLFGEKPVSQMTYAGEAFHYWHKVVENYSARGLTDPRDKLTAISGVVAQLQKKTGSRYVAGLWVDNIDLDLLWRRTDPATEAPRPDFIAPSFSWASIDGEVDYYCFRNGKRPYEKSATIISIETSTSPTAPFGKVDSGRLTIRGPITVGHVEESDGGNMIIRLGGIKIEWTADTLLGRATVLGLDGISEETICRRSPPPDPTTGNQAADARASRNIEQAKTTSHQVRCWAIRLGAYMPEAQYEFLILGKSATTPNDFERIGLCTYHCRNGGQDRRFLHLMEQERVATITLV